MIPKVEEKSRKMEAERMAASKNNEDDSDDDDLDDLLDNICIHPSMMKKPEPEVTQDDARRASEKFSKARGEEEKEKRVKEKWFTNSDKPEGEEVAEVEEDDGTFSFYKVPSSSSLIPIIILILIFILIPHFSSSFIILHSYSDSTRCPGTAIHVA